MSEDLNGDFLKLMAKKKEKVVSKRKTAIRDIGVVAKHNFICDAFTFLQQSNSPEKYFVFERLIRESILGNQSAKNLKVGDIEYRISYYIVSRKPKSKIFGKWVFGQYCPMIPAEDFENLIAKARKEKVTLT